MRDLVNLELERQIIGGLINDRDSFTDMCLETGPADFSSADLASVCKTFIDEYAKSSFIDIQSLSAKSGVRIQTLTECMEVGWMTADMKHKARRLADLAHKRRAYRACMKVIGEIPRLDSEEIAEQLSEIAFSISFRNEKKRVYDAKELVDRVEQLQEERKQDPGYIKGVRTGYYPIFDRITRGLRSKRMTGIAAATGFGKTTLALNLLLHVVMAGHRALFISCENDADDNLDRLCGIVSGLDLKDVESGANSLRVWNDFRQAFSEKTLFLSDNNPRNIDEICATISRYAIQHQIEIAFVDYIGEISGESRDRETEEMKLARYTQRLLDCVKHMNVHLVVLAQLNRQGNQKGRPTKAEIAGCFRIAQKAHTLLIFWQDENKEGKAQDVLTVEKNRQGPAGIDIAVSFDRGRQTIKEQGIWLSRDKEIVK
jgi:replicative DNA helicase